MKIFKIIIIFLGVFSLTVFNSCSTKKNKWNRRAYHNLTAHFNAYFNGKEALNTAVKTIEDGHIDDYSKVLSVFKLSTKDKAGQNLPNFERTKKRLQL